MAHANVALNFNVFLEKTKLKDDGSNCTDWVRNLRIYEAYDINGYTFDTEDKDMKRDGYQNSGVTMESYTGNNKDRYYGRIEEIWELSYAGEKVRCSVSDGPRAS